METADESARAAALRRYGILDTGPEPAFDDITRLAAQLCQTPYALITFVDADRVWVKSANGLPRAQFLRRAWFCAEAIASPNPLVIADATADPRFAHHPAVTEPPSIRSYAGIPLSTGDGFRLGTLCVLDREPRTISAAQLDGLRILSHQVMSQLELQRRLAELERSSREVLQTRDALRTTEAFYRALVENIPQHIIRKDTQGRFTFCNQRFCALLGRRLPEILGKTDHDFFPKHLADKYHKDDLRVIATQEPIDTVEANQSPDGETIFVHVIKTPLYNPAGEVVGIQGIFWDVTERKRTEEALAYERDLLRALLETIPDRIYFKDVHSRFLRCSSSMAKRLGLSEPQEVVGKTDFDFYPLELAREFFSDEQRIVQTGQPLVNKLERLVDVDGQESWVSVTKVPVFSQAGEITGLVGISRDVTQLVAAEQALKQARDAALETARVKSEFLANMSHEIRTPMNAITGMTALLLDTELNEEQREFVETVRSSTETLLAIINDILDFSKIEAGKFTPEKIAFDLREVVEGTVDMLAERAQSKNVELACLIDAEVPQEVRGDPGRLRQVLTNLVSNAIKFTERGEVVVRVTRECQTGNELRVRCSVSDTGIGIPAKSLPLIFQPFTQADGSTTRKYGGTGLGLAISKHMVELMRGEMGVESVVGKGSKFWFSLPLEAPAGPTGLPPELDIDGMIGARVLVVDDNSTHREILCDLIGRWKMVPAVASSAAEALELLRNETARNQPIDMAIIDMEMPGLDGLTLARTIKADPALTGTRLVMLTSLGHRVDVTTVQSVGIAGCVVKPVRESRLHDALVSVFHHQAAPILPYRSIEPDPGATGKFSAGVNLRILVAEDNLVNQRLALRQLRKLGYSANAAANGRDVLEQIRREHYDVIFMDCQMPEIDGYEVTRQIRSFEAGENAAEPSYIIALTANALQGDRDRCLAAGMNDYITKPVSLPELQAALGRAEQWLLAKRQSPEADLPLLDLTIIESLKDLRDPGHPDPVPELIDLFVQDTQPRLERIAAALETRDAEVIARAVHSLKGSARNLGAVRLAKICADLEQQVQQGHWTEVEQAWPRLRAEFEAVREGLKQMLPSAS